MRKAFTFKTKKVSKELLGKMLLLNGEQFNDGFINVFHDGVLIETLEAPKELKRSFEILPLKKALVAEENDEIVLKLVRAINIHCHSGYSLLDGGNHIDIIADKTELFGAVTDHGVAYGTFEFQKAMLKRNKKPIVGIEFYSETIDGEKKGNHLLALVKNDVGYRNMCKLISLAEKNMYYKPHVSYEMLEKYSEGLIVTSACLGGEIPQLLLKGDYDKALEVVEVFQGIFGDDFYLEIQKHNIPEEEVVNPLLIKLSKETGVKLVGTNDAHYPDKEDAFAHEVLLSIGTKSKLSDPKRYKFDGEGYHIYSPEEFEELFADIPEAIYNLYEIAEKCNFLYDTGNVYMPHFPVPSAFKDETSYFEHLCWKGFEERFKGTEKYTDEEYRERLKYEISIIRRMGYEGYFLIVWDFIKFAKDNGIMVGPGRGSAVGSLVSYCLRITDLDPIPYGLLFEREKVAFVKLR